MNGLDRLRRVGALLCLAGAASAQAQAAALPPASNQLVDPFSAAAAPTAPAPPTPPAAAATKPAPALVQTPPPAPTGALPPGLRAILIRDNGQGLLGSVDANALSIAVAHGKPVRIGGQDYQAEVSATAIRLYASPKGRLLWEGSLGSPMPVTAPLDLSQLKFVPPLSAGVGPGLRATAAKAGAGEPVLTRASE